MSTTSPVVGAAPTNTTSTTSTNNTGNSVDGLTQADFLKIMVAQFTNQDPLSDSDGSGSSGGSASYIQELMSMTNITTLQTMSQQQNIELAGTLPGATVSLNDGYGNISSGVVTAASIQNATLTITVNGKQYPATDLVSITPASAANNSSTASTSSTSSTGTGTTTPASS